MVDAVFFTHGAKDPQETVRAGLRHMSEEPTGTNTDANAAADKTLAQFCGGRTRQTAQKMLFCRVILPQVL